jgi:hypothetical protein
MSTLFNTFFGSTTTNSEGTLLKTESNSTTIAKRGNELYAPANSRICVNVSGTATVLIKSNPFGVDAMDVTLTTLSASGEYLLQYAAMIVVHVTAVSGTVTAVLVSGDD